jgi:hypothetical protein
MSDYDKTNRGQIWPNDKKTTEAHPDFRGDINVDGVMYWISAWRRKADASPKAPSLTFSIQKKEVPDAVKQAAAPSRPAAADDFDDDIPF